MLCTAMKLCAVFATLLLVMVVVLCVAFPRSFLYRPGWLGKASSPTRDRYTAQAIPAHATPWVTPAMAWAAAGATTAMPWPADVPGTAAGTMAMPGATPAHVPAAGARPAHVPGTCRSDGVWRDIGTLSCGAQMYALQGKHHPTRRHRIMHRALSTHLTNQLSLDVVHLGVNTTDAQSNGSPGLETGDVVELPQVPCSATAHVCTRQLFA